MYVWAIIYGVGLYIFAKDDNNNNKNNNNNNKEIICAFVSFWKSHNNLHDADVQKEEAISWFHG